eukprot:scaffold253220_cov36-Tisochrysis_lutea.AAC.2
MTPRRERTKACSICSLGSHAHNSSKECRHGRLFEREEAGEKHVQYHAARPDVCRKAVIPSRVPGQPRSHMVRVCTNPLRASARDTVTKTIHTR